MRHSEVGMVDVRRLDPTSWTVYREVRLAALADAPAAFGTTLDQASRRTDDEWRAALLDRVTFVAFDGDRPVGLVSGIAGSDPGLAELISMWVAPAYRRQAVGARLVREVARWARGEGYRELRLGVVDDNRGARGLYERLGFTPTGATEPYPNDPRRHEI
jgi:ribosomal protein S18 acetylase RimI-like enzyme